jgi:hypothetical protein
MDIVMSHQSIADPFLQYSNPLCWMKEMIVSSKASQMVCQLSQVCEWEVFEKYIHQTV